jgi:hypothetical protein
MNLISFATDAYGTLCASADNDARAYRGNPGPELRTTLRSARLRRNATFLLGSGVSASLLPLPNQLCRLVMSGRHDSGQIVVRAADGQYRLYTEGDIASEFPGWSDRVRRLLTWLARELGDDDYELLFFVARQIEDEISGEFPNPPLRPFIKRCLPQLRDWWGSSAAEFKRDRRNRARLLRDLVWEAQNYIAGAVASALECEHPKGDLTRMHAALIQGCRDPTVRFLDIVTLNHDTLFEASFKAHRIAVEDGFGGSNGPSAFETWKGYKLRGVSRRRLIKLHGSIDEWSFKDEKGRDWVGRVAGYPFRIQGKAKELFDTTSYRPRMLVGTTNKMLDYLKPTNVDRFAVFRRSLIRSSGLVIAGYGLRDKGVNELLIDWFWSRTRRVVLVDPFLDDTGGSAAAAPAIKRALEMLRARRRLLAIRKRFDEVRWRPLRTFLLG